MASTFNAQMLHVEHFLAQLVYSHLLLHVRTNKMGITFPQMDSPHMKSKVCICCTVNSYWYHHTCTQHCCSDSSPWGVIVRGSLSLPSWLSQLTPCTVMLYSYPAMKPVSATLAVVRFRSPPYGVWGALVVMLMRKKSALSPLLSVQLTVTFTAPLTPSERPTQERVETEGGPEERWECTRITC